MSDLIPLTGLWLNEKNGEKYFSGTLGNAKVLIFKNKHKEKENQPDYQMYLAPKQREGSQNTQGGQGGQNNQNISRDGNQGGPPPMAEQDIPF